ncbi:radical SAM protein [Paraburkholderia terricola]|uniref:radical SAM protein n=1 Tax=Paraburkholderia terricola TaxID=169427 RepID=UPI00285524EE|nr:radical SAM protein [Paraburkholderia terricola]MDR6481606.1 uncharacterized protein [Paraburkholderia terricola]
MTKISIPTYRLPELVGNGFLNLIIFPTEKCNFRCSYCYEDFKLGKMSDEVVQGIKNLISRRADSLELLEISWFGGEPMLAKDIIFSICEHAQHVARHADAMEFRSNITTNGYFLSIENFYNLVSRGVHFFQITLDGDRELHDRTANKECFERIWSNLIGFRNSDLNAQIELRVHYSPDTWRELRQLIEKINNEFSMDRRFSVYFKSIEHYGSKNDDKIGIFEHETSAEIKKFLENQLAHESMIYEVPYASSFICYAAKATSFGIRSNGQLVKCTVALDEERNNVGKIRPDGLLDLNQKNLRRWVEGLETGDKRMLECPNSQMRGYQPPRYVVIPINDISRSWSRAI